MATALLVSLGLWVAGGTLLLLLLLGALTSGRGCRRRIAPWVVRTGGEVDVQVRLVPPAASTPLRDHDLMLVVGHSGRTGVGPGTPMREAIRTVEGFVVTLPDAVRVAVVAFDHEARIVARFGADRDTVRRAFSNVPTGGGTAIAAALDRCHHVLAHARPGIPCTVIVLSDVAPAVAAVRGAADRLRAAPSQPVLRAVGVGPDVGDASMTALTGAPERCLHLPADAEPAALIAFLLDAVAERPVGARIVEPIGATRDVRLASVAGPHNASVQGGDPVRIVWNLAVLSGEPVTIGYRVRAVRAGWYPASGEGGVATWSMPDGSTTTTSGARGPGALVLPPGLGWTWPLLNPLFWMLVEWIRPARTESRIAQPAPIEPLPRPTLPEPLPTPPASPHRIQLRRALVIGIGEAGEGTCCGVLDRLRDREGDPGLLDILALQVGHPANRPAIRVGLTSLDDSQRVTLAQDLRPYLERLRAVHGTPARPWVAWREWLREPQPSTTVRGVDDRRKSRLALLEQPGELEQRLAPMLERLRSEEGVAIVVGAPDDDEASGLVAEVAHLCAGHGLGVTLVLAPMAGQLEPAPNVVSLTHELERVLLLRSEAVRSDRGGRVQVASRLFDRVLVVEGDGETPRRAASATTDALWCLLAYEGLLERLTTERDREHVAACWRLAPAVQTLPMASLWRWMRARTLATTVNGRWLRVEVHDGRFVPPTVDPQTTERDREAFWTGASIARPRNRLVAAFADVAVTGAASILPPLLDLESTFVVDGPYHEQADVAAAERTTFQAYLEAWGTHLLRQEQERGEWGLVRLVAAVRAVEQDVRRLLDAVAAAAANPDLATLAVMVADVWADLLATVATLRGDVAAWIGEHVGAQLELDVTGAPGGRDPLAYALEQARQEAERALAIPATVDRRRLEEMVDRWVVQYGQMIVEQVRFDVVRNVKAGRIELHMTMFGDEVAYGADLTATLRARLDTYRHVLLEWPLEQFFVPTRVDRVDERVRIGRHAASTYPGVNDAIDEADPFLAAAIAVRRLPLCRALGSPGVEEARLSEAHPYAWPEEVNAVRIAEHFRNRLERDPERFSPVLVHLLGDTTSVHAAMGDIAQGRVRRQGSGFVLLRDGVPLPLGPVDPARRGAAAFEEVVRRLVLERTALDGTALPPPDASWRIAPEAAVQAVEASDLGREVAGSAEWPMWRDAILALALEQGLDDTPDARSRPGPTS